MDVSRELGMWADRLRSLANEGLFYGSEEPYHRDRYELVRTVAAEMMAVPRGANATAVEEWFRIEPGHMAPYPCGDAAIFDEHSRLLLIRRRDNGMWALPGGAFNVGETPAEGACREASEETGVRVRPLALVGVYDSRRLGVPTLVHLYQFVFACAPIAGAPRVTHETTDVGWFAEDALPDPLAPDHALKVADAFAFHTGSSVTRFDR